MSYYVSGYDPKSQTIGDPSIYLLLNSENDNSLWTTGNSATWGASGSIAGTFNAKNPTAPLNGSYSYSFVMAAGSLNDWAKSGVISVPLRSRGVTNRTNLVYTYDGSDNDIKWIVYDVTNTTIVSSSTAYVLSKSLGTQVELIYDLPATCTQVQFGFQVLVANNTKILKFDDVQMSDKPFSIANLVINEAISYTGYTSGTNPVVFKTLDTARSNPSKLISGTTSRFTVLRDCNVTVTFAYAGATPTYAAISHKNVNGTGVNNNGGSPATTGYQTATMTTKANAGDYFFAYTDVAPTDTINTSFSITATAISENILQTWQDGRGSYKSLTYTEVNALSGNQGLGTFTAGSVEYMIGADGLLHYKGKLTVGTTTASEARIPFPNGFVSADTTKIPTIQMAGSYFRSVSGTAGDKGGIILVEPNVAYFTLGNASTFGSSAVIVDTKQNGNSSFASGQTILFNFTVPVQGVSSNPTLLALPVSTQTDYYIDSAGNSGQALTSNVTDIPFIAVTNNNLTWDGSGFTAPISGNYCISFSATGNNNALQVSSYINGTISRAVFYSQAASTVWYGSTNVYLTVGQRFSLRVNTNLTLVNNSALHWIKITRLNGKNDGVYIGNVPLDYQYNLTVTGTNWTTTRAVGVVYKTGGGVYRMRFDIKGSVSSGSRTTYTASIDGVTFFADSAIMAYTQTAIAYNRAFAGSSSGNITMEHASATTVGYTFSGDVELESKPSFATLTI